LSNRPAYIAILSHVTFDSSTLYYRADIFKYGMENVWAHPIFGIGLNDWQRPEWMLDPTVDNFWLLTSMRHGIPAFLFLATAVVVLLVGKGNAASQNIRGLRTGISICIVATAFAGTTVHFWGPLLTHLAFLLGMAATLKGLSDGESADRRRDIASIKL